MSPYTSNYNGNFINFTNRGKILNAPLQPRYIGDLDLLLFFFPSKNIYSGQCMYMISNKWQIFYMYVMKHPHHVPHTHLVLRGRGGCLFDLDL